jgi:SAM-dependent methyltransferase
VGGEAPDKDPLRPLTESLKHRPAIPGPLPPFNERVYAERHGPGLKNRIRAVIWRITAPLLGLQRPLNSTLVDQVNRVLASHRDAQLNLAQFQARVIEHLQGTEALAEDWMKRWDSLAAREARMQARIEATDDLRAMAALAQQTSLALKRDVERLLAQGMGGAASAPVGPPPDLDAFKYVGFEDAFRGSRDDIRARLAEYAPKFDGLSDIIDLGCGRGEFLELLKVRGTPARGVDINDEMVNACRTRGLDATVADALRLFATLDDASIGGVFSAQVVEHLQPPYLTKLLETMAHKVRPGGLVILETINPACWLAFFESFLRDVTHVWPLHPETLQYLMRASGFRDVAIEYRSPVPDAARLQPLPTPPPTSSPQTADLVETFNENVSKLNARLFGYQDYAVVARR